MTTTKLPITEHLTEAERLTLLEFAIEYRRDLTPTSDIVEGVLADALEKLAECLRLSSDW